MVLIGSVTAAKSASETSGWRKPGLALSDAVRQRFLDCRDPRRLEGWLEKAVSAGSVDELL